MAEKIKISKKEIVGIIKEEYEKKLKELSLKKRLSEVNSKINRILKEYDSDEDQMDEVEAKGEQSVRSTGWTGQGKNDKKFKPEFQIKGSHKLEEEEDIEIDTDIEEPNDETEEIEIDTDTMSEPNDSIESESIDDILSQLADAIDNKIEKTVDEKIEDAEPTETETEETEEVDLSGNEESEEIDLGDNEDTEKEGDNEDSENIEEGKKTKCDCKLLSEEKNRMQVLCGIKKPDPII